MASRTLGYFLFVIRNQQAQLPNTGNHTMIKMILTITLLILTATSAFALDYLTLKKTLAGMTKLQKVKFVKSIKGQMITGTGSVFNVKKKGGKCEIWVNMDESAITLSQDVFLKDVCLTNVSCDGAAVYNKGDSISFDGPIEKIVSVIFPESHSSY